MSERTQQITMHMARMAMNNDPEVRAWVEAWMKERERAKYVAGGGDAAAFDKHWLYIRPETMHEGALDGYTAYLDRARAAAES